MNEIVNIPYLLLHITSKHNYEKISSERKFKTSIHNAKKGKIQWLGDGVYFWDGNDENALELGKNLIKGKYKTNEIVGIYINVEIDKNKHINLENGLWYEKYIKFLKEFSPEHHQKINEYFNMINSQKKVNTDDLNKIGELIGTTINLFLKILTNNYCIEIDMVSGRFYHGKNKFSIFKSQDKMIRQFCIKNVNIVNDCINNWKIKYNI